LTHTRCDDSLLTYKSLENIYAETDGTEKDTIIDEFPYPASARLEYAYGRYIREPASKLCSGHLLSLFEKYDTVLTVMFQFTPVLPQSPSSLLNILLHPSDKRKSPFNSFKPSSLQISVPSTTFGYDGLFS
jgi:hypothetical protein